MLERLKEVEKGKTIRLSSNTTINMHNPSVSLNGFYMLSELERQVAGLTAAQMRPLISAIRKVPASELTALISGQLRSGAAVEELCATVFTGVEVQEWFAYGGEPFFFRLTAKAFARSEEDYYAFKRLIHVAKNVRSHLDSITIDASPEPLCLVVGLARLWGGNVLLRRNKPRDLSARLAVALNLHTSGTILLPRKQPSFRFNLPLIVSTARTFAGRIVIKSTGYSDIDDPLPADFVGSFIWFRFFAPTGKRGLKLRNARPDLTKQDLQDVADYLIDNQVLLNSKGDPLTTAVRASVVHTDEHQIIKPIKRS